MESTSIINLLDQTIIKNYLHIVNSFKTKTVTIKSWNRYEKVEGGNCLHIKQFKQTTLNRVQRFPNAAKPFFSEVFLHLCNG